ncbi:hypothetical protein [Nocardioides pantholopis]|uniref:hypothetical protein n=1 Tax=Nocardioides pantholopis TaxID=2483798 RepID=UPI000F08CC08|nr:hypothetical protein [Nocardioides pantholopis]
MLALGATACSGDDEPEPDSRPRSSDAAPTTDPGTDVRFGKLAGRLPAARRPAVRERIQQVFDRWVDAAYVGGEWPRADVDGAFADFTGHARARARRDVDLMSNLAIAEQVEGVEQLGRTLRIDVVSSRGRASGATARFRLRFRTTGAVATTSTVRGRLFLAPERGGWRIFGYDVSRGESA